MLENKIAFAAFLPLFCRFFATFLPLFCHFFINRESKTHGGKDSGTIVNGVKEKDLNLSIANILKKELIKEGATVITTRDEDYDLGKPNATRRKKVILIIEYLILMIVMLIYI